MTYTTTGVARMAAVFVLLLALPSCEFVGPTAPLLSAIDISANPLAIGLNGEVSTVTVIVSQADSNPPPNGTIVFLTTTLGTIPAQVNLSNGRAAAALMSGAQSGIATVTAVSGNNITAVIDIAMGSSFAQLSVTATPTTLPSSGGTSEIRAVASDENGEPLVNIPVTFTTTAGTLASGGSIVRTDGDGEAVDQLTTTAPATVTATSGSISGSVSITLEPDNVPPVAAFSNSPTSAMVGQEVFFNASASLDSDGTIVSYEWAFGDGSGGSGRETSHAFDAPGTYVVVLTVTDDDGDTGSTSRPVTITVADE